MDRRVKDVHPQGQIGQRTGEGQPDINDRDLAGDLPGPREDFTKGIKGFRLEDLHTTDAQFGQEHHRHNNDTDAAQPLQDRAPQQQPLG